MLAARLPALSSVVNHGIGGDTIVRVQHRLVDDCLALRPSLAVVGVGVNDSRFRPSLGTSEVPLPEFEHVANCVLASLRTAGIHVLVSGQVPVIDAVADPYKPDKHYRRESQFAYERSLQVVSARHDATYLRHFDAWLARGERFIRDRLADGLHPNDAGHQDLANRALEALTEHGLF